MRPIIITVNGTAEPDPFGDGFAGDMGRPFAFDPWANLRASIRGTRYETPIEWRPVGYPAEVFPMQPSVDVAVDEIQRITRQYPKGTPIALAGYSQGALATCQAWRDLFLDSDGKLHERQDDVFAIFNFGDPMRSPGKANGNKIADQDMPPKKHDEVTGGIAGPRCLKPDETPDFLLSCALEGDLYADAPVGEKPWDDEPLVGEIQTYIYDFVVDGDAWQGFKDIVEHVADTFGEPIESIVSHTQAIFDGIKFASAGQDAPHWKYQPFIPPLVDWLTEHATKAVEKAA